jgi:hypothetical protein
MESFFFFGFIPLRSHTPHSPFWLFGYFGAYRSRAKIPVSRDTPHFCALPRAAGRVQNPAAWPSSQSPQGLLVVAFDRINQTERAGGSPRDVPVAVDHSQLKNVAGSCLLRSRNSHFTSRDAHTKHCSFSQVFHQASVLHAVASHLSPRLARSALTEVRKVASKTARCVVHFWRRALGTKAACVLRIPSLMGIVCTGCRARIFS